MENFRKLGIKEEVLKVLHEMKFEKPTEIQEKTIPIIMEGKDVIAGAATGSGKTLAFGAGIIEKVQPGFGVEALILTPTRELAEQVADSLRNFSKYKKLNVAAVYGGVSIEPQIKQINHADVVVGTPGRILDHLQRRTLDLKSVCFLVLDEADRMFDMGFIDDVRKIIGRCPEDRQTLLFSATINKELARLSKDYMNDPEEIFAETNVDPSKLKQIYYDVEDNVKFSLLVHFLKHDQSGLVMVFCNTQRNTDFIADNLKANGINAVAIHGGHSQNKRSRTLELFHNKDVDVLVCTDVAARGLDIKDVSHVYNYDAPNEPSQYVHRIGRTARAGANGKAVSIIGSRDYENFIRIKREHPEIERQELPEFERAKIGYKMEFRPRDMGFRRGNRGGFGGRRGRFSSGGRENFRGNSERRHEGSNFRNSSESGGYGFRSSGRSESSGEGHEGGGRRSFGERRSGNSRFGDRNSRRQGRFSRHSRF